MPTAVTISTTSGGSKNLLGIRQAVVTHTGHYELVNDWAAGDYSDNGCDDFIRAACNWLDELFPHRNTKGWIYKVLSAGECIVSFDVSRYISQVWIADESGAKRTLLEPVTETWLRSTYSAVPITSTDTGTPLYWAPLVGTLAAPQRTTSEATLESAGAVDMDMMVFSDPLITQALCVMPPTDVDRTLAILGSWRSVELVNNDDVNFWTLNNPRILQRATRREIELDLHRNREEAAFLAQDIMIDLKRLEQAATTEEAAGPAKRYRMFSRK